MQLADKINLAMAVATALSVLVSTVMAVMTYAILKANRATVEVMGAQIEATSRPYVQVTPVVRPMTTAVELHIRNTGSTPASRLRLSLDQDYYFNAEDGANNNIRNYVAFSREMQMLAPGSELRFLLGVGHKIFSHPTLCPLQFAVTAEYSYDKKTVTEKTTIDLEPFGKSNMPVEPIVERLDRLVAELKNFRERLRDNDA